MGLMLCLWVGGVAALPQDRPFSEFIHRSWSVDEGLPHSTVRALAQSADGYVWLGTPEGISRFDGLRFDIHDSPVFAPLRGAGVYSLLATRSGALIIGTRDQGVWRYAQDQLVRIAPAMLGSAGNVALENAAGDIWISLDTDGLARISGDKVRTLSVADGLPSNVVRSLWLGKDGDVWVGTARGLAVVRGERIEMPLAGTAIATAHIAGIAARRDGGMWIATANQGVFMFDNGALKRMPWQDILREATLTSLREDRDGTLWAGSVEGLFRFVAGRGERLTTADGLSSNTVRDLYEDAEGGLWVGTDRGVNRYRSGVVRVIGPRQGLTDEFTRAVLEDPRGQLWIATSDGLFMQQKDSRLRRFGREQGLINSAVLSLGLDRNGTLWAGTYGGGLHRLAGGRFSVVAPELRKTGSSVRSIAAGREGELWVGSSSGLFQVDTANGEVVSHWDMTGGLPSEHVNALYFDSSRRLWIGTRGGLAVRDGAGRLIAVPEIGAGANVLSLSPGEQNRLWVSTSRGLALIHLEQDSFRASPVAERAALPEQSFFSVLEDGVGNIWICANRGLIRAPVDAVVRPTRAAPGEGIGVILGRGDGMPTAQCNGATQPSGWKTAAGHLLFATARGVAVLQPADRQEMAVKAPDPLIKSVRVDGAPVRPIAGMPLTLSAGSHRIDIEFIGVTLSAPERLRYEYRLTGQDDNWSDAKGDTKAVYANLPSGEYRFEVRTRMAGGTLSATTATLAIVQQPRLIETWWFRITLAMGLVGLIVTVIALRVRHLETQRTLLRETVEARTAELQVEKRKLESVNEERTQLLEKVAEAARAYEKLSKEDSLTGIANRRELDRILVAEFARAVRTGRPLSVVLADLDHFKRVNDQHSHATGDAVLKVVAQQLKHACRKIDAVGRYGGEEFLLILPETALEEALQICERLRRTIAGELADGHAPGSVDLPPVTMSFGVASLADDTTHDRLIARADAKLYEAKHAGRNQVKG
ncbi:MAG: diguanylate cyclase [Betaproteobacteria bacterium]|nr:diguanylate cyclase [Betaproteobacteria bacterium]